jgi:phosphoserine aminotransferase
MYNYSAGPGTLPQEVFEQAAQAVLNFDGTGLSILEISHRSSSFMAVVEEAEQLVKELLNIPAGYSVLFLHGGASAHFAQIPLNLLPTNGKAGYLDTGVWSTKAIKEASKVGQVEVVASSKDKNYSYIPKDYVVGNDLAYFHITTNNTIYGTEMEEIPAVSVPLVADMSSNIFSRVFDVAKFSLIYAGAQKNLGPAGLALVIVRDEVLGKTDRIIPNFFDYRNHIDGKSMYNTPPVFAIYVSLLTLRWLKSKGGIAVVEQENIVKARLLYDEIERNKYFTSTVDPVDRSRMNVVFVADQPETEEAFLSFAKNRGLVGLKGHRSVGGFRASIYNAMSLQGVHALIDAMQEFEEVYSK